MTQIEKEAFMFQYYGQQVLCWKGATSSHKNMVVGVNNLISTESLFLQLKSIESITDEDAIELFDLLVPKHTDDDKEIKLKNVKRWIDKDGDEHLLEHAGTIIDFLRSKGYLLPFRQYSTEQLIESGIVKI